MYWQNTQKNILLSKMKLKLYAVFQKIKKKIKQYYKNKK